MQFFTGIQYIMIDVANSFGLDKETWDTRLTWFDGHKDLFAHSTYEDMVAAAALAEEPAQFLAGINAYRHALAGTASGYQCGLDATASGIQLLSILAGCPTSALTCNLIDVGKRVDAYTQIYELINEKLDSKTEYSRKEVKKAAMTHFYGSKAAPRNTFGKETPELITFYEVINELLPGADMLNHDLLSLWQPDAYKHSWTLPDGFEVDIKVMAPVEITFDFLGEEYVLTEYQNQPQEKGLSIGANVIHSLDGMVVREMGRRCLYDGAKINKTVDLLLSQQEKKSSSSRSRDINLIRLLELVDETQFMSMVIFEYLDELNIGHLTDTHITMLKQLIMTLPGNPFELLAIHDCFKFHPNNGNEVRKQYANILADIAESNVMSYIATQIMDKKVTANKISPNLGESIRNSNYALS